MSRKLGEKEKDLPLIHFKAVVDDFSEGRNGMVFNRDGSQFLFIRVAHNWETVGTINRKISLCTNIDHEGWQFIGMVREVKSKWAAKNIPGIFPEFAKIKNFNNAGYCLLIRKIIR